MSVHAAAITVSFTDSASSKILKTPIGTSLETLAKAKSKHVILIPGVFDPKTFTGDSAVAYHVGEPSGSGDDYYLNFKFSDDPKYTAGAASVKVSFTTLGTIPSPTGKVLGTATVKFGKDSIIITINDTVRPVYAQTFLNFSFKPRNNPEGKGTGTTSARATIAVGTISASAETVSYTAAYTNKSKLVNGVKLFSGSSKGGARSQ
jgi:hypothetical protein